MAEGGVKEGSTGDPGESLGIKAILVGATGAIGECLLGELVASKNYSKIVVLGRRESQVPEKYGVDQKAEESSGRLQQHKVDFEQISNDTVGEYFKDKDVFFCTLGTTRKTAGSAEAFHHIDHDYVVNCAKVARDVGVSSVSYVSSQGANANSWFLYPKTKGEVEEALKNLKFKFTSIYRPGLLDRGSKKRFVEKLAGWVVNSIAVSDVAKAMRVDGEKQVQQKSSETEVTNLYFNDDMWKLCSES
ncbi:oxidoreductase HTATIP2-like [Actinia tenebrosa]|uniref:Protein HTATIP2 n=1 Tax=Actinia tenebrosa TaxID=6105 RepID=A0A6P8HP99_ACTTE|nr:oxidoreductase HTATIP2-like [Actinia tenebrosa]